MEKDKNGDFNQSDQEILLSEVSDEALEIAAATDGGPLFAISFNFLSFHLHCC